MELIRASYEIINEPNWEEVITELERAIRTCYKSENAITPESADRLIRTGEKSIIKRGHESTLEHKHMSVRFIVDRGVSHELVRHRLCSFSQESTRYVNYSPKGKNNQGDMKFILPCWMDDSYLGIWDEQRFIKSWKNVSKENSQLCADFTWMHSLLAAQANYNSLIELGWKPEHARSVLPNSLKTEIVMTTNMRDWRHIFHLRCDKTAHPQMREVMYPLWKELSEKCPTLFDSVKFEYADWTKIGERATKASECK